jgi:ferredoxin
VVDKVEQAESMIFNQRGNHCVMFKINLRTRDGASIVFDADTSETLLDAAARSQILLPSGCREGACGACRVTCNEGEVALDLPKHSAPE